MLKKLITCATLFLCMPFMAHAARISFFLGDVTLLRNGKKTPIAVGGNLETGDVLRTGKDSLAEISDNSGGTVKLRAMSTATIGSEKITGSDSMSLIMGDMTCAFKKLIKGSVKIYTPTTIAAVRGTEFAVAVSAGGDTRIGISEGAVEVRNPYGSMVMHRDETIESLIGQGPRVSSGTSEEWKRKSNEGFRHDPAAKADDTERYLSTLNERAKGAGDAMIAVQSAVKKAASKESLEHAGSILNDAAENTTDDAVLNDSLAYSLSYAMEELKGKDEVAYDKFHSALKKTGIVAEQHKKNIEALNRVREEYQKAYKRIMGAYKNKSEEIRSKFKDKKSDM